MPASARWARRSMEMAQVREIFETNTFGSIA
jgi:hypothetical protein